MNVDLRDPEDAGEGSWVTTDDVHGEVVGGKKKKKERVCYADVDRIDFVRSLWRCESTGRIVSDIRGARAAAGEIVLRWV